VPVNAALQLMVDSHEGKKPSTTWTRPSGPHAARGSTTSKTLMLGRCRQYGDPRLLEVTEERNGPSGLRDDDDDDWRDSILVHILSCLQRLCFNFPHRGVKHIMFHMPRNESVSGFACSGIWSVIEPISRTSHKQFSSLE